jgi:hypothetical protein
VWFHLGDPARLERLDKVGHTLPQIRHLLESADHCHRSRIIELMFDSKLAGGRLRDHCAIPAADGDAELGAGRYWRRGTG